MGSLLNTVFLVTALGCRAAVTSARRNERRTVSRCLAMAIALAARVVVKVSNIGEVRRRITLSTNTFYMFYSAHDDHLLHVIAE